MHKKERKKSTFWQDFKAFMSRGNIVDLAIGLVVGAAFTAIVNSLVNDIIKPLIALLVDGDLANSSSSCAKRCTIPTALPYCRKP